MGKRGPNVPARDASLPPPPPGNSFATSSTPQSSVSAASFAFVASHSPIAARSGAVIENIKNSQLQPAVRPRVMASANKDDPILRLKNNLVNIWKNSEYSDLLIRCNNGDEHRAHRVILCSQSEFFRRACNPKTGFKVQNTTNHEHENERPSRRASTSSSSSSNSSSSSPPTSHHHHHQNSSPTHRSSLASPQEALSGVIELRHDDPDTVRAMLEFCYTFTYTCRAQDPPEERMIFHVHMYAVGEIYDLPALKRLATANFEREVDHRFPRFPAAVRAIYETTPASDRALRDVALRVCAKHARDLLGTPAFDDMMDELGVFGRELARQLAARGGGGGGGGANHANGGGPAHHQKPVVVDCRKYRCTVCRRAVAWNIPKPCPTELLQCMYCGAGFAPATWKKRIIKPEDPPEPEDLAERPSSAADGIGDGAGW